MEILAQKKHGLPWIYLIFIVFGVISIVAAVLMFLSYFSIIHWQETETLITPILILIVSIHLVGVGCIYYIRIKRTPDQITLNGTQVDLGNGLIVNVSKLEKVDYREHNNSNRWGTLTIYLENQKITYYYYNDVQHARDRMTQLIWESKR